MADIRHFYKDTTSGVFLIDGNAIPGGKYNMLFYSSDTIVELVDVTNNQVILGPIEIVNLRKENDTAYTNKADLLTDVVELFESGGGGGGGTAADTSSVATDNITSTNVQADKEQIDTKLLGYTETASAASTTVLDVNSTRTQRLTGTTTHIFQMPVVSTLTLGRVFEFQNDSTGILTINSSGGNTITTLQTGETKIIECVSLSGTGASSWKVVEFGGGGDIEPYEFTFDDEIDLSKLNGYSETTLVENNDFTPKTSTAKHGFSHVCIINPDGYTPTFSGFELIDTGFDWNPNINFQVLFQKIGAGYFYSIFPYLDKYLDKLTLPVLNAITVASATQLDLSWSTIANVISWQLEYSLDGLTNWTQIGGIIDAATLSYSHTGLTTGTEYHYRLKAIGDNINYIDSNYSDIKINSATNAMFDGFESSNITYTNNTHLLAITSKTSARAKNSNATSSTQILEFRLSNDYNSYGMVLCLHGSNDFTDYASMKHTIHMSTDGNQMKYKYNGGSFVSSGVKYSGGRRFRMRRGGGNIYWEYSDDNGITWTEVFSGADSGTLYILADCQSASSTGVLISRTY